MQLVLEIDKGSTGVIGQSLLGTINPSQSPPLFLMDVAKMNSIPRCYILRKTINRLNQFHTPIPSLRNDGGKGDIGKPKLLESERPGEFHQIDWQSFHKDGTVIKVTPREMSYSGI